MIELCGNALSAVGMFLMGPDRLPLMLAMILLGIIVGATHCSAMCSPFVLARVLAAARETPTMPVNLWDRMRIGLLPGYHTGRTITYMALGALAGVFGGTVADLTGSGPARIGLVALGMALVLGQATLTRMLQASLGKLDSITRIAVWLGGLAGPQRDLAAGMVLGLLPCGMLYGAVATTGAIGHPLLAAIAMAGFALGTWIPLGIIGTLGTACVRGWHQHLRRIGALLMVLNLVGLGLWLAHSA